MLSKSTCRPRVDSFYLSLVFIYSFLPKSSVKSHKQLLPHRQLKGPVSARVPRVCVPSTVTRSACTVLHRHFFSNSLIRLPSTLKPRPHEGKYALFMRRVLVTQSLNVYWCPIVSSSSHQGPLQGLLKHKDTCHLPLATYHLPFNICHLEAAYTPHFLLSINFNYFLPPPPPFPSPSRPPPPPWPPLTIFTAMLFALPPPPGTIT